MDNWTIHPLGIENGDIADSEEGSDNEEISDVVLADLPEEGLMDEPAAKPSLLLRDPHMNITVEEQEHLLIPPPPLVADVGTTGEEEAHPYRHPVVL
ncbi:hypothetical protein BSL78_30348 [Apostichopus japonicus]|uniref:Uncharacterized protein n=1 Tax=Stichopus japonicus TaxID=307972 RepID=A0A2G8JAT1_STIJA|nr:hypothetical protein BSL78_30348 [Apostichopus japonicus]